MTRSPTERFGKTASLTSYRQTRASIPDLLSQQGRAYLRIYVSKALNRLVTGLLRSYTRMHTSGGVLDLSQGGRGV